MKRLISTLVFFVCIMFVMTGCMGKSNTYTPPEGCLNDDGTQKGSIILKYVEYPNETALALKLATTTVASEISDEHVKEMINVLETSNEMLDGATYSEMATFLLDKVSVLRSKYSVQLMIVTQYAQDMVNIEVPIHECDKALLRKHFNEQIQLLKTTMLTE